MALRLLESQPMHGAGGGIGRIGFEGKGDGAREMVAMWDK